MATMKAKDISLVGTSTDKSKFCEAWPLAKEGLTLLEGIVKNPFVKGAIHLIINAGDAIAKSICG